MLPDFDDNFTIIYKLWKKFKGVSEVHTNNDLMNTQDWNLNPLMDESDLFTDISCPIDSKEQSEERRIILNERIGELTVNNEDNKYEIQDNEMIENKSAISRKN